MIAPLQETSRGGPAVTVTPTGRVTVSSRAVKLKAKEPRPWKPAAGVKVAARPSGARTTVPLRALPKV